MGCVEKLFIIHTVNMTGGSSKSIRGLISNLNESVDLLVNADSSVSNGALKKFYGENVRKIYRFHLPFRQSALGLRSEKEWPKAWLVRETDYLRDKKKIYDLIRLNRYRYIHLNSYVLYPLLTADFPMYIHIREIFEGGFLTRKIVQRKLRQAKGIIYIDHVVKESMCVHSKKEIVLNNPFNQRAVLSVDKENVRNRFHLQGDKTIFTFVSARSDEIKGCDYVINEFIRSNCVNAELLIAGSKAPKEYKKSPNVHFLGRIEKMEEIYAISDFVVRGDIVFAVGRTIYEALYSGCHVIIPGAGDTDKDKLFEYDTFRDQIMFYEPRGKGALAEVMKRVDGKKKEKCLGLSNEDKYIRQFLQFIEGE
ncbi:MAG: glycosyltransferase [Lachnospiraceae bacterium]|nr:glycosyltransferase [Lachnospiraceae bacterium]